MNKQSVMNVDSNLNVAIVPTAQKLSNAEKPNVEKLLHKTISNLHTIGYYSDKTQSEVLNAIGNILTLQDKIAQLHREIKTVKDSLMEKTFPM